MAFAEMMVRDHSKAGDELRALAGGDIDADGQYELVAVTTNKLSANDRLDILIAFEMNGDVVDGFPPNTTGASGCDDNCYPTGSFDQNIAEPLIAGAEHEQVGSTEPGERIPLPTRKDDGVANAEFQGVAEDDLANIIEEFGRYF